MDRTISRRVVKLRCARELVLGSLPDVQTETAGIINCLGRVLAEDVRPMSEMPPEDTSTADGYAAVASDTKGADSRRPVSLSVLSSHSRRTKLQKGTLVRVRAGDPLPHGADSVISTSLTYRPEGGPQVLVMGEVAQWENVQRAGSVLSAGETAVGAGTVIGPAEMGLIASLGMPGVAVSRRPRVAVVTTGAGIVDVVEQCNPGEARNSVRYSLVGMLLETGCDLGRLIHTTEGRIGIEKALAGCLECDAVVVALGASDSHDHAVAALETAGETKFDRVQMEPGAATAFAVIGGRPVFVIGADTAVEGFEAIVRPALLAMLGSSELYRPTVTAALGATLKPSPDCCHYIRAVTTCRGGTYAALPLLRNSCNARQWALANSLILISEGVEMAKRGEPVEVALLSANAPSSP